MTSMIMHFTHISLFSSYYVFACSLKGCSEFKSHSCRCLYVSLLVRIAFTS
ncbi:hypothetical protein PF008_g10305 [Phytophthora fragariae]|uniref:SWIM-type domain-containing protein n=1 Tax=Phytophthora fragariae TaxID=53985 RepID=A0A6G0RU57_9STRA|nr:hypothetical protein PF008_g10305 [Phytophthora fragariae]